MLSRILLTVIIALALTGSPPRMAEAASSLWFKMAGGEMRLVTAAQPDSRQLKAALEIKLDKGWKTYWRSPGESGIPPQFSFSGSKNVANVQVEFPVPSYFTDLDTKIVGYKNRVVFPISVTLGRENQPVVLNLDAFIGICEEVCVPVQAKLKVSEPGTRSPTFEISRVINDAAGTLPSKPGADLQIVSANWQEGKPDTLLITSLVPEGIGEIQLYVEGPREWYLLPAKLVDHDSGQARFVLDITDIPKDAKPASTELKFTLVAGGRGIEQLLTPQKCNSC